MDFPVVGDFVFLPVGDGRKLIFLILEFDGSLALMRSTQSGEHIKKGEKICYRLNGKERFFNDHTTCKQ